MFFKIGVLKNKTCNFIKKRLQHRCFSVKFAKILRTYFLTEHLGWLLLNSMYNAIKKETYSEPSQTSKMELFANIVNGFYYSHTKPILDVWQGSEDVSVKWKSEGVNACKIFCYYHRGECFIVEAIITFPKRSNTFIIWNVSV